MNTEQRDELAAALLKGAGRNELALRLEWAVGMLRVITSPKVEELTFARLIAVAGMDMAMGDDEAMANADSAEARQSLAEARAADAGSEARSQSLQEEVERLRGAVALALPILADRAAGGRMLTTRRCAAQAGAAISEALTATDPKTGGEG